MKIKNNIFAIKSAVPAINLNPDKAATIATTKKIYSERSNSFLILSKSSLVLLL